MKTIIALRGKGNSGKTTTIRILHDLLLTNDYAEVRSNFRVDGGDFITIFRKRNKLVGVTSSGDTYDLVHSRLQEMVDRDCKICVCACRTFDRVPPGTNAAILEFQNYANEFIEKTVDGSNRQSTTNSRDARILFDTIESKL